MSEVLQTNIFFFITSVAVVAFTLMLLVVLWYVVAILREVHKVAKKVSQASEGLERDIAYVRGEIVGGAQKIAGVFGFVSSFLARGGGFEKRKAPTKRKSPSAESKESV